jgi:transcriptional regulator with XRE-family HTH domain
MDNKVIGARLRKLRKKLGYTGGVLGRKVGVSQAQISRFENGIQGLRSAVLIRVAKALGVRPVYFFLDEKDTGRERIAERLASYGVAPSKRLVSALAVPSFRRWVERAAKLYEQDPKRFKAAKGAFKEPDRACCPNSPF